ncbi:glycosyltransferase family 2 protein [Geobacter argillaceus]|uniref:Glycosyltransferase involved in cell wall biosynthesis n=1 Tax=Geobacter argillaceus TaxID=345631 RepID=A0A562VNE0_9BACT|nr:glycosyltransferase family 2 protein [Geobacter argillaceus]TWJ19291.1 glycosyltransferase involved in cell wall biosynthesis [Geobacter argillaceus]
MNNLMPYCLDDRYATTRSVVEMFNIGIQPSTTCGGLRAKSHGKASYPAKPLISIITPVLNGASHIEETISSVINQRYDNIEFIVIDGCSVDGTLDILHRYDHCIDFWISEKDNGVYDAMNKGFKLATGDWMLFLGGDDLLVNCLDKVASHLMAPATIYYGDVYMPGQHSLYGGEFSAYKLMCRNIPHQAIFYPRIVGQKYCYDEQYRIVADYELNIRCFNDPHLAFSYMPILIAMFDDTNGLSATGKDEAFEKDKSLLLRRHFSKVNNALFTLRHLFKDFDRNVVRPISRIFKY